MEEMEEMGRRRDGKKEWIKKTKEEWDKDW